MTVSGGTQQKPLQGHNDENVSEFTHFTHVGVLKPTKKKIALLAQIHPSGMIYKMIDEWADLYWQQAREAGMVTDAMVAGPPPDTGNKTKKKRYRLGRDF